MSQFLLILTISMLLLGCESKTAQAEKFLANGIEIGDQTFAYMHFRNENEGYLFGTLRRFSLKPLPRYSRTAGSEFMMEEADIFQTQDGGRHWKKIDSLECRSFYGKGAILGDTFYIPELDFFQKECYLRLFSPGKKSNETKFQTLYAPFLLGKQAWYSIPGYAKAVDNHASLAGEFGNEILSADNSIYTITFARDGVAHLMKYADSVIYKFSLPINPGVLAKLNENEILVGGQEKSINGDASILRINTKTNSWKILASIKGHCAIRDLQSNGAIIAGLAEVTHGLTIEYDFIYSNDSGSTWHLEKLSERSDIQATSLVGNVFYLLGIVGVLQKITIPT